MYQLTARNKPLLLPFAGYVAGLLLHQLHPLPSSDTDWVLGGLLLLLIPLLFLCSRLSRHFTHRRFFGIAIWLSFLALGILSQYYFVKTATGTDKQNADHLLRVDEYPTESKNSYAVTTSWLNLAGTRQARLKLYLQKDEKAAALKPGNLIVVRKAITKESTPLNPGEFDFSNYLSSKGVHFHTYLNATQWRLWQGPTQNNLVSTARELKLIMLNKMSGWPVSADTKALTMALILGERSAIEQDTLDAYASAGGMHVLAVSGLHTGIFYLILNFIFRPLRKWRWGKPASAICIVLSLWGYALITGLSASVVRAVCMFSLMAIGSGMKRQTNIYNTLLASAMLLLLFWPGFLFQVGFQLSYAALLGIVSLFPMLNGLLKPKLWLFSRAWDIICVSIAAQIGTLPLALLYFHQFPSLFIITNLLVLPLVSIIMYLGILCIALSFFSLSFTLPFRLLDFLISLMNGGVAAIESTKTTITDINLAPLMLLLLYLFIGVGMLWWYYGRYRNLRWLGLVCLLILMTGIGERLVLQKPILIVYHLERSFALGVFRANEGVVIAGDDVLNDSILISYRLKGHWQQYGVTEPALLGSDEDCQRSFFVKRGPLIVMTNQSFLLYQGGYIPSEKTSSWIVVKDLPPPAVEVPKPGQIILTAAVSDPHGQEWLKWVEQGQVWQIKTQGPWRSG